MPSFDPRGEGQPPRRWVLLALAPGLLADALFSIFVMGSALGPTSDALATLGDWILYSALFLPVVIPLYLLVLGPIYVKRVYGGLKPVSSFVVMHSFTNFILWVCGAVFWGSQFRWS